MNRAFLTNPARLVWAIVIVALGAATVGVTTFQRTLAKVAAARASVTRFEIAMRDASASIERTVAALDGSIHSNLSEARAPAGVVSSELGLPAALDERLRSVEGADHALAGVRRWLDELESLSYDAATWRENSDVAADAFEAARNATEERLRELRAAVASATGRQRLAQVRLVRDAGASLNTGELLRIASLTGEYQQLQATVAEVAALCERLAGESSRDRLVGLRDNQLAECLGRLLWAATALPAPEAEVARRAAAFRDALLGLDATIDSSHQTIVMGSGGLYNACARRLVLAEAEGALESRVGRAEQKLQEARGLLLRALQSATTDAIAESERVVSDGWRQGLQMFALGAPLFLLLGARVAGQARRQFIAVREARDDLTATNRRLEAERERAHEAQRLAEAASRAKSDFLANMSHEIRTPMTAILGYSDLLADAQLAPTERDEFVRTIRRNGEHLLSVINDILDISKIEAGRMTVELIPTDPRAVIEEVIWLMRPRSVDRGLTLRVECGPLPISVLTDPVRFRQILINIIGNAVKFTQRGSVTVVASAPTQGPPRLRVDVIDTGIGISPAQLGTLFRSFTQADTSTTRRFGGTGLGLVISRRLADMLGGTLEVRSELGRGSTFTMEISAPPAAPAREIAAPAGPGGLTAPARLAGTRVLLVEDGIDNQRLISAILRKAGASVEIVCDGRRGVDTAMAALAIQTPFDVVLMDMQLPELDGYEAAGELRRRGYAGPVIALTAHAMQGDRERCLAAGCSDYLVKPIDRVALFEACRRAITPGPLAA